jgi:hypothetical protein
MENTLYYTKFLKKKGRPLSEINPDSDEIALEVDDALKAIEMLKDNHTAILGGDILSEDSGEIIYAYQLWGEEYHYLNWYCEREINESKEDYVKRSYILAKEGIANAHITAEKLKKKCYIVFVIE